MLIFRKKNKKNNWYKFYSQVHGEEQPVRKREMKSAIFRSEHTIIARTSE